MEPKEIRDLYTDYARIERDNHQKAHPGYKFSPMKPGSAARKRKDATDDEDEQSELESLDQEWVPSSRNRSRRLIEATPEPKWLGSHQAPYGYNTSMAPSMEQSSYQYSNPSKPLPVPMVDHGYNNQYYQTVVRRTRHPNIEDVMYHKTQIPSSMSYGTTQALSSVPGGGHHELLDDSFADSPASLEADFQSNLDPSLTDRYGGPSFSNQQQLAQDRQHQTLQSHAYPIEESLHPTGVDPEYLGDKTGTDIDDAELADFLREANGS